MTGYHEEIEKLIGGSCVPPVGPEGEVVEDPAAFALEKHLEDFLLQNWGQAQELGQPS